MLNYTVRPPIWGFFTFYGLFLSESLALALNTDRTSAEMAVLHLMDKFLIDSDFKELKATLMGNEQCPYSLVFDNSLRKFGLELQFL